MSMNSGRKIQDFIKELILRYQTHPIFAFLHIRYLETILYARLYHIQLSNYDKTHYLASVDGVRLFVNKHSGIGLIREVFCDQVYGKLSGDVGGKTIVDVGAFIGDTAIYFSKKGAKEIYAFEPNKESFELAKQNLDQNKIENVHLYNYGITDNFTEILERLQKIDLLKMDCEGCEYAAILSTPKNILLTIDKIILEYHKEPASLIKRLEDTGFKTQLQKAGFQTNGQPMGYIIAENPNH